MRLSSPWTTERKATFGFVVAFVLLAIVNISGFYTIRAFNGNAQWVTDTQKVLAQLEQLWASLLDCESGSRAFVLTGDATFLDSYEASRTALARSLDRLSALVADNPPQVENLTRVRAEVEIRLGIIAQHLIQVQEGNASLAVKDIESYRGKLRMDRIRSQLSAMQKLEEQLLVERDANLRRQYRLGFAVLTLGSGLQLAILAIIIASFQRDGRKRREIMGSLEAMSALQQATLDGTNYAIVSTDANGVITVFNRGAEEMLGYSAAEMVGRNTADFYHDPEDLAARARETSMELGEHLLPGFGSIVARARRGMTDERRCLFRHQDGSAIPVTLDTTPMRTLPGTIIGYLGIARDISVRLRAQAAAEEANQERRSMMEAMPDIIIMTSAAGELKRWNSRLETMTSLHVSQLKDLSIQAIFRATDTVSLHEFLAKVVRDGSGSLEVEILNVEGAPVTHHFSAAPLLGGDGHLVGITGVLRDITNAKRIERELRSSESRLRLIASNAPIGIFLLDAQGRCTYSNPRWREVIGISTGEAGSADWQHAIHPEDQEWFPAKWQALLAQEMDSLPEFRCCHEDGSVCIVRLHVTPVLTADGTTAGWVGVVEDVTVQQELYGKMEEAKASAEEANLAKGMFLANMSHEIRTPLNGVIGMTGLLLDTELSPRQRDFAEITNRSAESLLHLLNDLLDLSKVEAGMLELEEIDFDLRSVVEQSVRIHAAKASAQKLTIASIVSPDVPTLVQGDPSRLEQVLINLVGNAIKFTSEGEVTLRVEKAMQGGRSQGLRFQVIDTGIGISAEGQKRLFTAFMQEDGSTTRRFGGTGLGLAISRRIIEQMGGEISVSSELGRGSTFAFSVPMMAASQQPATHPEIHRLGLCAMVLDENATVSESIASMLESWGVETRIVPAEAEILSECGKCSRDRCDLVLFSPSEIEGSAGMFIERCRTHPRLAEAKFVIIRSIEDCETMPSHGGSELLPELRKPVGHSALYNTLVDCFQLQPPSETSTESKNLVSTGGLSVLVAEDNPVNLMVITHLLQRGGHQITSAADGKEAVTLASHGGFDVVLMDCEMPHMSGYAAAEELRRRGTQVPIIALTANSMEGDRERCLAAGMQDYLSKPVRSAELERVLTKIGAPPGHHLDLTVVEELRQIREPDGTALFDQLVGLFQKNSPVLLSKARSSVSEADFAGLRRSVHTLKGSCSTFGAVRLAHFCQEIEKLAGDEQDLEKARELVSRAEAEYKIVETELIDQTHCIA